MSVLPILVHLVQMGPPVSRIRPHSDLARWDSWQLADESVFKSRLCIFSIHIVNVHNLCNIGHKTFLRRYGEKLSYMD